ncbi:MAG: hypothetical protein RL757_2441 [Bacteroidota bacterium]|jgi:hypothetical protein
MKNLIRQPRLWGALGLILVGMTACNSLKLTDAAQIVPRSSASIRVININRIGDKLNMPVIKELSMMRELRTMASKKNEDSELMAYLTSPSKTGINFDSPLYFTKDEDGRTNIYFLLKNPADFTNMVKKMAQSGQKKKKKVGEKSVGSFSQRSGVKMYKSDAFQAGMKGNVVILSMTESPTDKLGAIGKKMGNSKVGLTETPPPPVDMVALFAMKPEQSILQDVTYKTMMMEKHDMYSWSNLGGSMAAAAKKVPMIGMMFDEDAMKNSHVVGYTDFLNGKMVSHADYNLDESLASKIRPYFKSALKADFGRFVNLPNQVGSFTIALEMNAIQEKLENSGMLNFLPIMPSDTGVSAEKMPETKDLMRLFDGDMAVSVVMQEGKMVPIVAVQLKDKTKLLELLAQKNIQKNMRLSRMDDAKKAVYAIAPKPEELITYTPPPMDNGDNTEAMVAPPPPMEDMLVDTTVVVEEIPMDEQVLEPDPDVEIIGGETTEDVPPPPPPMEGEDDATMATPDYGMTEAPTKKKSKFPFKFNRVIVDGDMLVLTDSSLVELLFEAPKFVGMENNKAILTSQVGLTFSLENLMASIPQAQAMKGFMKELPIQDMQFTFKGKSMNMVMAAPKKNENFIMSVLKSVDQLASFFLSMKNAMPPPSEPIKD